METADTWVVSDRQRERVRYRRRTHLNRATIAAASTLVTLVVIAYLVTHSPGWGRVRETYCNVADAKATFPAILRAFWLNVRLFMITEVATLYTDVFRCTPTLLVVLLVGFGLPTLQLQGVPNNPFWLGVIALTLSYGAYVAEVIRAGILSVHPSQWASGRSLGLSHRATLRSVILPQALRRVTPPLLNDFVSLQ